MKWMLIYILINNGEPMAINAYGPRHTFDDMYDCFHARESLSEKIGTGQGYFGNNQQAVCVPVESTDT